MRLCKKVIFAAIWYLGLILCLISIVAATGIMFISIFIYPPNENFDFWMPVLRMFYLEFFVGLIIGLIQKSCVKGIVEFPNFFQKKIRRMQEKIILLYWIALFFLILFLLSWIHTIILWRGIGVGIYDSARTVPIERSFVAIATVALIDIQIKIRKQMI